jgi:hypothetical protein
MMNIKHILILNSVYQNTEAIDCAIMVAESNNADLEIIEIVGAYDESSIVHLDNPGVFNTINLLSHQYAQHRRKSLQKIRSRNLRAEYKLMNDASHQKILCQSNVSTLVIKPVDFFESTALRLSPSEAAFKMK